MLVTLSRSDGVPSRPGPSPSGGSDDADAGQATDPDAAAGSDGLEPPVELPPRVDPGLDPDAGFEWVETLPGRGTCRAGTYVGAFQCITEGFPILITGQVAMTLAGSSEAQLLSVVDGRVGDPAGELFGAGVVGQLDCVGRTFSGATVSGIAYTVPQGSTPLPFAPLYQGFEATLSGAFDDQELVVGGSWVLRYELGGRCVGLWRASAQP